MERGKLIFLIPLGAVVMVGAVMLGLGALFSVVGNTGTIGLGLVLVVGVPGIGYLIARRLAREP